MNSCLSFYPHCLLLKTENGENGWFLTNCSNYIHFMIGLLISTEKSI